MKGHVHDGVDGTEWEHCSPLKTKTVWQCLHHLLLWRLRTRLPSRTQRAIAEISRRARRRESLLEAAEVLSGQLEIEKLTEIIMNKGRSLTHSDRCSLVLGGEKLDRLVTSFQRGLDEAIEIPLDKGIAGETVKSGKVLMITDAYEHPLFASSQDLETFLSTRVCGAPFHGTALCCKTA